MYVPLYGVQGETRVSLKGDKKAYLNLPLNTLLSLKFFKQKIILRVSTLDVKRNITTANISWQFSVHLLILHIQYLDIEAGWSW